MPGVVSSSKRRGLTALLAAFAGMTALIAASAAATPVHAVGPDAGSVYIDSISYGGSGCPQGSVGQSFANDRQSFTLIFDQFVASSGPGVPVTESRKNCQINLNVHVPAGQSLATATFDYRGYVGVPSDVTATSSSLYYLSGEAAGDQQALSFEGPASRDYLRRDTLPLDFSDSCSERIVSVSINAQVRLIGALSLSAQVTTDSIDGKVVGSTVPCGPTTKDDCKKGGWQSYTSAPGPFKNQGDCVSYVATGGKNTASGQ